MAPNLRSAAGLLPVLLVFFLIMGRRWTGARAGAAGWLAAAALAWVGFGAGARLLVVSQVGAVFLAADVLAIIWAALLLHAVMEQAGAFRAVTAAAGRLADRPVLAAATIGWALATLLQGVAGFGVPVAVVAPLLLGLGFAPEAAVIIPSLGHGWAVTFGSIGNAMQAMVNATGLEAAYLAPRSAWLASWAGLGCGIAAVAAACGWRRLLARWWELLGMALLMGAVQMLLATTAYWPLASLGSGLAGLAWGLGLAWAGRTTATSGPSEALGGQMAQSVPGPRLSLPVAMAPYGLLWVTVVAARLPAVADLLGRAAWRLSLPATATSMGWHNAAAPTVAFHPLFGTGPWVMMVAVVACWWYRRHGIATSTLAGPLRSTVRRAARPSAAILLLVGMGEILTASGMTHALALLAAAVFGQAFAWVVPWIGALGALITGTNTNSNLLFARMELVAARSVGLDLPTVMALQNLGGAMASILSPAKIMVGLSTVGMAGAEGRVMRRLALPAGLIILGVTTIGLLSGAGGSR
ncbi:MAG TPA: L-lactate permease [Anaerolineae bacterium]|nr:L-lactate permease [Anaerolineae bacterium]